MEAESNWENAENILCVRLDSLGDVLMSSPALRAIKEGHPERKIILLTSPEGANVANLTPEIDEVISYEAPWMKSSSPRSNSRLDYMIAAQLQQAGFDAAIIFTVYSQNPLPSAFLCYLAGIPLRLAHCRENPYHLLTNWVPENGLNDNGRHEVRRQLDLVRTVGYTTEDESLSLHVPEAAARSAVKKLEKAGIDLSTPWVAIHPGASAASRRYPPEGFMEVSQTLVKRMGIQVVFTGSKNERPLVASIREGMSAPSFSLAGQLDLGELAAVLQLAPLLISNNTGPVHVSAAVGTPVVDLYALTNPQHTPWMVTNRVLNHDVDCKYCYKSVCPEGHHDCLRRVSPEEVVSAACDLLVMTAAESVK